MEPKSKHLALQTKGADRFMIHTLGSLQKWCSTGAQVVKAAMKALKGITHGKKRAARYACVQHLLITRCYIMLLLTSGMNYHIWSLYRMYPQHVLHVLNGRVQTQAVVWASLLCSLHDGTSMPG
jgi:hypothetical protein